MTTELTQRANLPVARYFGYRPELDGLRALAVVPVVLYHLGWPFLPGGFVGVDIFFVLSGYLMAAIIRSDIESKSFRILRFYHRRARRILPALVVVLVASSLAAWILFMPKEFEYFAKSLRAAVTFTSNIQFRRESGYFDLEAHTKPLLHTWSLSIEEQFYIFFPLAFLLLSKSRKALISTFMATTAITFLLSCWAVFYKPESAFYLLQYRAWELLLGSVVAVVRPSINDRMSALFGYLGAVFVLMPMFFYNDALPFPGLFAALPCLGAAAIILAKPTPGRGIYVILQSRPAVSIGKISYSVYLWHWPLIVFSRYINWTHSSWIEGILIGMASLMMGYLSWRYVEQPCRHASDQNLVPHMMTAAATLGCIGVFANIIIAYDGLPSRLSPLAARFYASTYDQSPYSAPSCFTDTDGSGLQIAEIKAGNLCKVGDTTTGRAPSFVVWGDSHAAAMAPAIDLAAKKMDITGRFIGRGGCPPLPNAMFGPEKAVSRCVEQNEAALSYIKQNKIRYVFLVAYWPKYFHRSELPNQGIFFNKDITPPIDDWSAPVRKSLMDTITQFQQNGTRAILVLDVPEMGVSVPEALARAVATNRSTDIEPPIGFTEKRQALSRATLSEIAERSGSFLVDPLKAICDDARCHAIINGTVMYKDADHLTASGARSLTEVFDPVMLSLKLSEEKRLPNESVTQ